MLIAAHGLGLLPRLHAVPQRRHCGARALSAARIIARADSQRGVLHRALRRRCGRYAAGVRLPGLFVRPAAAKKQIAHRAHPTCPARYKTMLAAQHAASVGIIPTLNRKIAIAAASEMANAQPSMLAHRGASNASGPWRTGSNSRNTVWMANQTARLSTTPTTAAVIAERAP